MVRLQQRADRITEANDIGIVPFEPKTLAIAKYLDNIDRANRLSSVINLVKKGKHLLLVGNGYIETLKSGFFGQDCRQVANLRQLKILVFSINALLCKEISKIASRKRMSEGIADESVGACHMLSINSIDSRKTQNYAFYRQFQKKLLDLRLFNPNTALAIL